MRRRTASPRRGLLAGLATLLALAGCSDETDQASPPPKSKGATQPAQQQQQPAPPHPVRCPPTLANCSTASGRIIYVERVDPDGDGDAHFVIASSDSITAPGISVLDLRKSLCPSPLPGTGDWISAAGPVYQGSHGQSQIEAVRVQVRRRN